MPTSVTSAYCHTCERPSRFEKQGLNHLLHLALTVLTIGLWGIVWLVLAIGRSNVSPRCVTCGRSLGEAVAPTAAQETHT